MKAFDDVLSPLVCATYDTVKGWLRQQWAQPGSEEASLCSITKAEWMGSFQLVRVSSFFSFELGG